MTPDLIDQNAATQNRYRVINEHLAQVYNQFAADPESAGKRQNCWSCSASADKQTPCGKRVKVSAVTYERIRADPTTFILTPGHGVAAVEEMIERGDGFLIARNFGRAAAIARAADPRRLVSASLARTPNRLVF
jgi:hypothetical protein